ncbi:hypothetical protein OHA11_04390 [Streptomyces sp. NBC_00878]|nr:hypothetical protein [Streptomyces sp. NBC_00878]
MRNFPSPHGGGAPLRCGPPHPREPAVGDLNSLALGDDVAASVGRRLGLVRLAGVAAVTLPTGASVAVRW